MSTSVPDTKPTPSTIASDDISSRRLCAHNEASIADSIA